jgi:23S rRNA (uracil747-C5)-methyltransferase
MNTFCSYYNQSLCKSCDLIHLAYPDQIHQKEKKLYTCLSGLSYPPLLPTVSSVSQNFRNKAKFVITGTPESVNFGLVGTANLDEGLDLSQCSLHLEEISRAVEVIKEFIKLAGLNPYKIGEKTGELKGVILFVEHYHREIYLRFILRSRESIDRIKKHLSFLTQNISRLEVVTANLQPVPHAILEGEEEIFLSEKKTIHYQIGKLHFPLGPKSFVQTNQLIAEKLYLEASAWLAEIGAQKMVELFCGQGFFTFLASSLKSGVGIEINAEAVQKANQFALENSLNHLKFIHADAGEIMEIVKEINPDTLLVNPPRKGLGKAIEVIKATDTSHLIYSSCNVETLGKDLNELRQHFKIKKMRIFDMFPQSSHFETLVLLERVS